MARPWQPIGIQTTTPHGPTEQGEPPTDQLDVVDAVASLAVSLLDRRREYRLSWDKGRMAWVIYIR